jgi:hypothetical protein
MLRFLATLAFAVSFDIILTGGKYVGAVDCYCSTFLKFTHHT